MDSIQKWYNQCLRKRRLKEEWADDIIMRAEAEGCYLRKYVCPYCQGWHVTAMREDVFETKKIYYEKRL